jgi:parvulin-like peptidyl-prolyl isomerase
MSMRNLVVLMLALVSVAGCSRQDRKAPVAAAGAPPEIDEVTPLPSPIPEVVARVNGTAVPRGPVLALAARGLKSSVSPDSERPGVVRRAMHQYIIRELLLQQAVVRGIVAKQENVDAAHDASRSTVKDDKEWAEKLALAGFEPAGYRDELRAQMTVSALLATLAKEIPEPSESDAAKFYAANPALFWQAEVFKTSRILVAAKEGATPEERTAARKKADALAARVKAGEAFEAVAKKSSDDPDAKQSGGLRPAFSRGQGVPAVEKALLALKPGEVSAVVETPAGFEIVRLHERTDGRVAAFEEVKPRVITAMRQQTEQANTQALVNSLRAKAKIETYL